MTTLRDQLDQLAADAPDGSGGALGPAAADYSLWSRGKRLQRRRRAGTAVVAAALVLAIGSMTALLVDARSYDVPVADAEAPLGLPSAIYQPSPWTPGTDETGPIGPLVAVTGGYRRTTWGEPTFAPVGVSASGGYAFLELPGLVDTNGSVIGPGDPLALSPNGRWVAYYLTGSTTGEPYLGGGDPIVGVALHDTVSGETRRRTFTTEHGLDVSQALTWVGDTVLVEYAQIDYFESDGDGGSSYGSIDPDVLRWNAATDVVDPTASPQDFPGFSDRATAAGDELVVAQGNRGYDLMSPDGSTDRLGRLDVRFDSGVFVNPGRTLVATTEDPNGPSASGPDPSPIVIADVEGPGAGVSRPLEGQEFGQVIGWQDDRHVIVAELVESSQQRRYLSVDVESGAREQLLEMPLAGIEIQTQIAADALSGPSFEAPEPDFPGNPRRPLELGVLIVVLAGGSVLWRSRVRP